jgi:hypothetical protein
MNTTKLTVRVPKELLVRVKGYAKKHNTTVTNLIGAYLQRIPTDASSGRASMVNEFRGLLSPKASLSDYYKYLDEKYGK